MPLLMLMMLCDAKELKAEWRHQKTRIFTELNKDRQVHIRGHIVLTWEHMMQAFKPAWDKGFTVDRNLRGWRMEGMIPFNRNALWSKRADLLLRASKTPSIEAQGISSAPPTAATPAAPPPEAAPPTSAAPPVAAALDPTLEDVDAPLVLGLMTERVQEAVDYIKRKHAIVELTQVHIMTHLIRLQECSDIVAEFATTKAEKPKADKQRITARDLFGNKGSATGPEARKLLATKHADAQAKEEEKAAKNEERNQAKAIKVAREVTQGAEVLKELELFGNPKLNSLTLTDLVALLTNANPQGNETRPTNKSEAMLRVRALSSVQGALSRCALAIAVDPAPLADAHPPAPAPAPAPLSPPQSFFPS